MASNVGKLKTKTDARNCKTMIFMLFCLKKIFCFSLENIETDLNTRKRQIESALDEAPQQVNTFAPCAEKYKKKFMQSQICFS
jgi:F0F1-type ATP synthase membrane subunit b/b'